MFILRWMFVALLFFALTRVKSEDKFIKRYALMKLYETCFGHDVVKQIRKEMRQATAKCNGGSGAADSASSNVNNNFISTNIRKVSSTGTNNQYTGIDREAGDANVFLDNIKSTLSNNADLSKLQQAILTGYNKHLLASLYGNGGGIQQNAIGGNGNMAQSQNPYLRLWNAYSAAATATSNFGNQFGVSQNPSMYSPQQNSPAPNFMPPVPPMNPFYQPPYIPPYFQNARTSRDLDIRHQLETIASKISGRVKNVTCVMQELGYLDENLEPNFEKILEKIKRLPISQDLKEEMSLGVDYCRQFSMCVPDEGKQKFTKEMVKPAFFFRCYKYKKMEACIMKDIKERYSEEQGNDLLATDRSVKGRSNFSKSENIKELAIFELLYGEDSFETDGIF